MSLVQGRRMRMRAILSPLSDIGKHGVGVGTGS